MKSTFFLLLGLLALSGCQSFDPAKIYPSMPANSSFERQITTVWGQSKVTYKTGPQAPATTP